MAHTIALPQKGIILVVSKSEQYHKRNIELIKTILRVRKKECIYISLNRPSGVIFEDLTNAGVDLSHIFIVDCATRLASDETERAGNVIFVDSPSNLTEMGTVLESAFRSIHTVGSFLFLDSLSTLLLYNNAKSAETFIHFLTLVVRTHHMAGVIVSLEDKNIQSTIDQISQFCDSTIEL